MNLRNNFKWIDPTKLYLFLSLLFAIGWIYVSMTVTKGDEVIWFSSRRTDNLNLIFQWITKLGEEYIFIAGVLISLFISFRTSISIALAGIFTLILAFILKSIFSMPRPLAYFRNMGMQEELGSIKGYEFHEAYTSFPSGHTMGAFCIFFLLTLISRNYLIAFFGFILAASAGISRIYLGQHFSADISVGSLLGVLIAALTIYLTGTVWKKHTVLDASFTKF